MAKPCSEAVLNPFLADRITPSINRAAHTYRSALLIRRLKNCIGCYSCNMAMDQRDWYRDLLRKKSGYVERADFRRPVDNRYFPKLFRGSSAVPEHWLPEDTKPSKKGWPLLLQFGVTIAICGFIFIILKIISQILR